MAQGTKRLLALLLALVLCISLFPTAAFAEDEDEDTGTIALVEEPETAEEPTEDVALDVPEADAEAQLPAADENEDAPASGQCGDDLYWSFDQEAGALTISGTGEMWNWDSMESPWYAYRGEIISLLLSDGITSIGDWAFDMCTSLTHVMIPASVTSIGEYGFAYCTALKTIEFIGSAPSIGDYAFAGVTAMAYYTANDDTWTEEVRQDYGGDITWPVGSPNQCGDNLYWSIDEDTGVLTITGSGDMWDWFRRSLTPWAWVDIDITAVELPDGLTSIGNFAFLFFHNLEAIEIPASVTRIGHYAFYGCGRGTSAGIPAVEIPASVTSIGHAAFGSGALTEIIVAEGNENYCSVDGILYNKDVTTLIQCPARKTGEVVIPDTVTRICGHEKVEEISFGDGGVTYAGAFTGCTELTSVTIPESVTAIEDWTFSSCSGLTNVILPKTLTTIGDQAFYSCNSLPSITIPESVTSMGNCLFLDGNSLHTVLFTGSAPSIGDRAFLDVTATAYYPAGDETWTEDVRQNYGGTITWVAYEPEPEPEIIASGQCGDDLTWTLTDNGVLTIEGTGAMWDWDWSSPPPWFDLQDMFYSVVIERGVTRIGNFAFAWDSTLTSVTIPEGVTSIGERAFESDTKLARVILPEGLEVIGWCAFHACGSLPSITIPASVWRIDAIALCSCDNMTQILVEEGSAYFSFYDGVLYNKDRTRLIQCPGGRSGSFQIADTVTTIETWACVDCKSLIDVTIPASVIQIVDNPFSDCISLREIHVAADNPAFTSVDGVLYDKTMSCLIACPGAWSGTLTIPEGVTTTGNQAIGYCPNLTEGVFPEGMTEIGSYSLSCCTSLRSVTIPESMSRVVTGAFSGCGALETVHFMGTQEQWLNVEIENDNDPLLRAIVICTDGTIDKSNQCGDNLTWSFDEATGVLTISGTGDMWDYEWPYSGNNVAPWLDYQSMITALVVEPGVTSIGSYAFLNLWNLQSVELADSVTRIGSPAFSSCSNLTEFRVPAGVKVLPSDVLSRCNSLTTLILPAGLERIESWALDGCCSLADVYYGSTVADWAALETGNNVWLKVATIHCTDGDIVPDAQYCGDNATWTLEDGVLTISGTGATWDMYPGRWHNMRDQITRIVVEEGITGINRHCFYELDRVSSVSLPESVTSIYQGAFYNMSSLESLELPETLEHFGHEVFIGTGLRKMKLPANLTTLPARTFQRCPNLQRVELPEGLTAIDEGAFRYATALDLIVIPAGVTRLEDLAFDGCTALKHVWFLGGAPEFAGAYLSGTDTGTYTFRDVTATVHYPADDPSWTEEVRQNYGGNLTWVPYTGEAQPNPFTDVKEGKYYTNAVLWAISQDPPITNGTSDTTFSPKDTCTRGQVVTFLWNAFGKPEPGSTVNPFVDVKAGKYYTKAVLWAVENGITNGVDATHFDPSGPCTRAQVVTFLWKAYGKPAPSPAENPFVDVKAGKYYTQAVLWAVENGITNGVDATHFDPSTTCTRGQVVTFLYNARDIPKP